jgi:hypothetical protein
VRYELAVEIFDAAFPASTWMYAQGDLLTTLALEYGADEWRWISRPWGVVLEIAFSSERNYAMWREVPAVRAAFDAVPDPVGGLVFHRGWGGSSGSGEPRRPRPFAGAGSAELPVPEHDDLADAVANPLREPATISGTRTAASA